MVNNKISKYPRKYQPPVNINLGIIRDNDEYLKISEWSEDPCVIINVTSNAKLRKGARKPNRRLETPSKTQSEVLAAQIKK